MSPLFHSRLNTPETKSPISSRAGILAAAIAIIALGVAAYHATFQVPFLFDDTSAVLGNQSIRQMWPLSGVWHPPADATVAGRPLLNLSFAINYAFGGFNPTGYHVFNLAGHLLAGLTLFGIVRRTLESTTLVREFGGTSTTIAFVIAVVWVLHPVQTASVTYVSQRAEAMMGLFYLLTLYAFVRRTESQHAGWWEIAAVIFCALGMATKEVMITAPVIVLLYDRAFVSRTFRLALTRHWRIYVGLAATWILAGYLQMSLRGHGVGFGLGMHWYEYALTECEVVVRYVGLSLWPHPLVFDYGENFIRSSTPTAFYAFVLAVLLVVSVVALRRRPAVGFLGAWFFIILAPTSSFVPIVHQPMAENRLYLPLVAVIALVLTSVFSWVGRRTFLVLAAIAVAVTGGLTLRRNTVFSSEITLWRDTLAKRPDNARAHYNLGHALSETGNASAAVPEYEAALALKPDYAEAENNLGNALARLARRQEALAHFESALRLRPEYPSAHYNLGITLMELRRIPEAITHFEAALQLEPAAAGVHYNLAGALVKAGRGNDAVAHYAEAVRLSPVYPEAETNWGNVLASDEKWPEAMEHYEKALRDDPNYFEARIDLGNALVQLQRLGEAATQYEAAIRIRPESAAARYNLGNVELAQKRLPNAIVQLKMALQLDPQLAGAHHNLALALVQSGQPAEAVVEYRVALQLAPNSAIAHHNLAVALGKLERFSEAIAEEEAALRISPEFPDAREYLMWLHRR